MDNRAFLTAEEVAQQLGTSKAYAYGLIKKLNKEMAEKGYITINGRINRNYFNEKMYGAEKKEHADIQRR